jgi:hypothetical protein
LYSNYFVRSSCSRVCLCFVFLCSFETAVFPKSSQSDFCPKKFPNCFKFDSLPSRKLYVMLLVLKSLSDNKLPMKSWSNSSKISGVFSWRGYERKLYKTSVFKYILEFNGASSLVLAFKIFLRHQLTLTSW